MKDRKPKNGFWIKLIGFSIALIGFVSILGYLLRITGLYLWYGETPMAINTALCFILTGTGIFLCGEKADG